MLKKGFTLAEVLLTLTIIGVVAAITMPALMTNVNDNILEAQTRKFYSSLTDGLEQYKAQNNQDGMAAGFILDEFRDRIMHTSSDCGAVACFADAYTNMNRQPLADFNPPQGANVRRLRDGSVFDIQQVENQNRWEVIADVNGRRGPNRMGEDLWRMFIDADGRIEINHIHAADCQGADLQGSCVSIFASNNFRFRDYRTALANDVEVAEAGNGAGAGNGGLGGQTLPLSIGNRVTEVKKRFEEIKADSIQNATKKLAQPVSSNLTRTGVEKNAIR